MILRVKNIEKNARAFYTLLHSNSLLYYKPFSKDCNDDLKLAHIIESKTTNIHIMAEFLESSLEKLNSNDTPIQEKENIMDKLEQIDSIKPFNERLKGILENAKENLQAQSYTKGRGR